MGSVTDGSVMKRKFLCHQVLASLLTSGFCCSPQTGLINSLILLFFFIEASTWCLTEGRLDQTGEWDCSLEKAEGDQHFSSFSVERQLLGWLMISASIRSSTSGSSPVSLSLLVILPSVSINIGVLDAAQYWTDS